MKSFPTYLSICNKELDELIFSKPSKIIIYGEAATGKTNLLLNILRCSVNKLTSNRVIYYISTEGSIFLEKVRKLKLDDEKIFFSIAIDQHHLATLLIDILRMVDKYFPSCIIIDSINSHYRIESHTIEGLMVFTEILTMLDVLNKCNVFIVSSAQIRSVNSEQEIPGHEYLERWADIVLYISREHPFYRVLKFRKPSIDKVLYFDITLTGIRWIKG